MRPLTRNAVESFTRHPERIVQFGGGNFLRGFVDWVVEALNAETDFASGIALVKATPGAYAELDAQDCLFTTWLHGARDGAPFDETRLIRCVNRTVYPYQDFADYLALARQAEIRLIFSNTTEAGIVYSAADRYEDAPPATFPAKLTRFLHERYRRFNGAPDKGCVIIPTELISDNGDRLREIVLRYAETWGLGAGFAEWIAESSLFCNTLVDRIIPGFPEDEAPRLFERIGYEDRLLVAGESYHSWIIEAPRSLLAEFPVDRSRTPLNVKIVADAAPYRTTKVRLLNGAHTAMVPLGIMLGLESVRDAVEHETLGPFIRELIYAEVIPSVTEVAESELIAFADDVFQRFGNPRIHHRLLTIALNSASKVPERILPSLLGYLERRSQLPNRLVIALAGFIRLYKGEWGGAPIPLQDDPATLRFFAESWARAASSEALVEKVLSKQDLWGRDLNAIPGLSARLAACLRAMEAGGLPDLLRGAGG